MSERENEASKYFMFLIKCVGGFSQKHFRKNKFTNKPNNQTEGNEANDRHILDLELVATIINCSIVFNTYYFHSADLKKLKDVLMDGKLNLHPHSSRKANVGETTYHKDGSVHKASDKVSDYRACKAVLYSFWQNKKVHLSSFEASHMMEQVKLIRSEPFRNCFSDPESYLRFKAWYFQITQNVYGPEEGSQRHSSGRLMDISKFMDVSSKGIDIFYDVAGAYKSIDDCIKYVAEEEEKLQSMLNESNKCQIFSPNLEQMRSATNHIEDMRSMLDDLSDDLTNPDLFEPQVLDNRYQLHKENEKRKKEKDDLERKNYSQSCKLLFDDPYPIYTYSQPAYLPMIQTHDGCIFPVGTNPSAIRNCLISRGTFESGHGPISDCPIVDTSDL